VALRLQVEARAEDSTVEAVSVIDARGYALGVRWHLEYWATGDPPSRKLFEAFGEAVHAYARSRC
jgi:putative glutamine amidotransferase